VIDCLSPNCFMTQKADWDGSLQPEMLQPGPKKFKSRVSFLNGFSIAPPSKLIPPTPSIPSFSFFGFQFLAFQSPCPIHFPHLLPRSLFSNSRAKGKYRIRDSAIPILTALFPRASLRAMSGKAFVKYFKTAKPAVKRTLLCPRTTEALILNLGS
jgi:hypothetical protein